MNPELFFSLARPLSPIYASLMRLRERLYDKNILLKSHRLDKPVISIGNLSMGGTGKTPHVIEIARFLVDNSFKVCVLTRGYGSKAGKGPLLVKDDFKDTSILGDEPVLIYESVKGVNVVVGSNRLGGAIWARKNLDVDVFLLDDGFQHLALRRDIDIVLLPYEDPFSGGRVFPGGYLREPISALKRANCFILTSSPDFYDKKYVKDELQDMFPHIPVFLSKKIFKNISNLKGDILSPGFLEAKNVIGFCGIAKPKGFKNTLIELGCNVIKFVSFKDHYEYKEKDIKDIYEMLKISKAHFLMTTSKDGVKLDNILKQVNNKELYKSFLEKLLILNIKVEIEPGFWQFLKGRL